MKQPARITSFLREHILGTVLLAIFCSVAASFIYSWITPPRALVARDKTRSPGSTLHPTPSDVDAPIVRFTDGKRAFINFSVVTSVLEKNAARVVATAGDREHAVEALSPPTEAAIFTLFERLTYQEAGTRRKELEATLLETLRPRYETYGLTLDSVSLKAFTLIEDSK
jgi:hypothetical protein